MRDEITLPEGGVIKVGESCKVLADSGNYRKFSGGRRWYKAVLRDARPERILVELRDGTLLQTSRWDLKAYILR